MKICFVSAHPMTYPGGVQNHILSLKKEYEKRGHEVKIIYAKDKSSKERKKDEILFGRAVYIRGNASRANLSLKFNTGNIKETLEKEDFDVLHFQNFGIFLPWQVLRASRKIKGKRALNILTLHAFWDASRMLKILSGFFSSYFLPRFDALITVSEPVSKQIRYNGISEIIPNGIDLKNFSPEGEKIKKFCDDKINILFVGRIEERKGLAYLLKAFEILKAKYKDIRLIVVGDGFDRKKMERFTEYRKIQDVFFEGEVTNEDLPRYYRTADICCFPAIFGEAFGIVLLEAMASGKPIVAFSNAGYKEVLTGKGKDFLVEIKNIKGLSQKLERLIQNKKLREGLGYWGREEAEKYSWFKIASRTLNFYDKVIKSKSQ